MTVVNSVDGSSVITSGMTKSGSESKTSGILGKEDFLSLLVAQLKNQDPLNPDEPTEFTAQLAQFSSLEQLFNMNESMESLTSAQKESDRFAAMGLIGKEISYPGDTFSFDGQPVNIGYQINGPASAVTLTIKDENGTVVATQKPVELSEGNHFITWDGTRAGGEIVPAGNYKISVYGSTEDSFTSSVGITPLVQSDVKSVSFNDVSGDTMLHTMTGAEVSTDAIISVHKSDDYVETDSEQAGTAARSYYTKSAPMDEDQIAMDTLQHYLAGK